MAKPKPVGAYVDTTDLSIYADRGILNLEQIGFLNESGTSHTLHNPGGSDGQIQYNDGGGFGGSTTEFDDATGQTLFASGTASDPSISFKDSTSTGLFLDASGLDLHIVADGTEHFDLGGGVTRLLSNIDAQTRDISGVDEFTAVTGTFTEGLTIGTGSVDITPSGIVIDGDPVVTSGTNTGGGEVNTASNIGGGTGVFNNKDGVDLRFRSFVTTAPITVGLDNGSVEIGSTFGSVSDDTTPLLGGNLDAGSQDITAIAALTAVTGTFSQGLLFIMFLWPSGQI